MKKILGLLMVVGLMVSLGGCGDKDTPTGPQGLPVQGNYEDGQIISEGERALKVGPIRMLVF